MNVAVAHLEIVGTNEFELSSCGTVPSLASKEQSVFLLDRIVEQGVIDTEAIWQEDRNAGLNAPSLPVDRISFPLIPSGKVKFSLCIEI